MSVQLPHPDTMTEFDPRFFDLIPGAKRNLGEKKIRVRKLEKDLIQRKKDVKDNDYNGDELSQKNKVIEDISKTMKNLKQEIMQLDVGIRRLEHEKEYEIWCSVGAVVEGTVEDGAVVEGTVEDNFRARGKVEGVTDMYCWIRTDWGRFTCLKSKCIGIYYATKPQAQNYPVDFKRMTQEEQKNLIDPIEKDDENVLIHDRWCEVGAVIKYLVREHNFLIDGKVEGRTEDYLWISTKIGRLIVKKTDCRGHLTKFEGVDGLHVPFQIRRQRDLVEPEDGNNELG